VAFYNSNAKYFYVDTNRTNYNDFWKEAASWDIVMDAYQRNPTNATYRQMIDDVYNGFMARNQDMSTACNTSKSLTTISNPYNDDIGWWAKASIRAFTITHESRYLNCAQRLFDFIYRYWDTSTNGGGILWNRSLPAKNTCTNAPAVITAAQLSMALSNKAYLTKAQMIYNWVKSNLTNGSGIVYDGVVNDQVQITYNYGTFIGAADALYQATKDPSYLTDANNAAKQSLTHVTKNGILRDEGTGDNGGFKAIYAQYLAELVITYHQSQYLNFLQQNATMAWNNRRRSDNLVGNDWTTPPTPTTIIDTHSASSAVAILQVTPFQGLGNSANIPRNSGNLAKNDRNAKPVLGWSTWNFIGNHPTQANIEAQAIVMANTLKSHGYTYILLDDFYYLDPSKNVDAFGRWVVDTSKFPNGLTGLAQDIHKLGLKFGAYLTPGIPVAAINQNTPIEGTPYHAKDIADTSRFENNYNYGGKVMYYINYSKPGAQEYVNSWAIQLASWGVDFLKMDGVGSQDISDVQAWSNALNYSGRTIFFDLSNNLSIDNATIWRQYANAWRTQGDIECYTGCPGHRISWGGVLGRFKSAAAWAKYAGPGGWNDLDALDIAEGKLDGINDTERQTAMTLWAIAAAPLYLGDDLTSMDNYGQQLLTNDEVIAQDQAGRAGAPISQGKQQVWRVHNSDGTYTIALFNLDSSTATVTINWSQLGLSGSQKVHDLWAHKDLGSFPNSFSASLHAHGSYLIKVGITPINKLL
jgi:predicted alpha-1,6-mannanase (GH76 family)